MGISICRLGDISTGHSPYTPRANNEGSPKVFADGKAINRLGDTWISHSSPNAHSPILDTTAMGSHKVFADGLSIARVGDLISCGDIIATGSSKTFSG